MRPIEIHKHGTRFFIDGDVKAEATFQLSTGWQQNAGWHEHWWTRKFKGWEPQTFHIFDAFLDPDHSYIDVGAWIGPTVLYGANKARRVICLEPDPEAHRVLMLNLAANPELRNVTVVRAALSSAAGTCLFGGNGALGNSESTMLVADPSYSMPRDHAATFREDAAWRDGEKTEVRTVTIEDLLSEYSITDCNFVKIDIEGGEKIVIPAIEKFLRRERPALYLSLHWVYLEEDEIARVVDILTSIYPVIYAETLRQQVSKRDIIGQRLTSIICMPGDFSTTEKLRIRFNALFQPIRRRLRP